MIGQSKLFKIIRLIPPRFWTSIRCCPSARPWSTFLFSMSIICPTIKVIILKMEKAFHSGYCESDKMYEFLIVFSCIVLEVSFHLFLGVLLSSWWKIYSLIFLGHFCCPHILRLKPRSWLACCCHLALKTMLGMILLLEFCLMMRLWNEVDPICWARGWIIKCMSLLCGLVLGWRSLIQCSITLLVFSVPNLCLHIVCPNEEFTSHSCNIFNGLITF